MKNPALSHTVIAVLLAVVSIGAYWFWLARVEATAEDARSLAAQIEEKSGARALSATARLAAEELAEGEAFVATHAVSEEDVVAFLETLEVMGRTHGASVDIASVSDVENGRITIALSIEGSFEAVMRTIGALEHGPYAGATGALSLDARGDSSWRATYRMSVAALTP
ncbi:MAG TPA: hypothetical protein VEB18_00860 [Candidatus Paceibacterota bacterium]|nr:hypothetical protein [Candidatus Paceibacterota bacterium]